MTALDASRWYQHAFDADYLRIYAHRDQSEAARAVELFVAAVAAATGGAPLEGPVLDLACGNGRHAAELLRRGIATVGLDLSTELLVRAMIDLDGFVAVRADMRRLPFATATFAAVANFFTSFGYFGDDAENEEVAREVARVLRPGGLLLWDHIHPAHLRAHFNERSERRFADGSRVAETRVLDDERRRVTKRIHLVRADGEERVYLERVRTYEPEEAAAMFDAAGFDVVGRFGDYDAGAAFGPASRRQILLLRRRRAA